MQQETVTIQQEIKIEYNTGKARKAAIARLLKDTNWIVVSEGAILNLPEKYVLAKTENIKLVNQ